MSLFENFPYTNLHQLNLDWLIEELNRIKEMGVISVNGETGEVILYQDPDVIYPNIAETTWNILRIADGITCGIQFNKNGTAYIVRAGTLDRILTENHPPAYPVTSVNGQTGAVTLYQEQYIRLPDLTGEQLTNWNIYRKLNNVNSGIQFDAEGNAYIMYGNDRYVIYNSNNYPDLTQRNILLPDLATGTNWSISRFVGSNNTEVGLELDTYGNLTIIKGNESYQVYSTYNEPSDFDNPSAAVLELVESVTGTQWGIVRDINSSSVGVVFVYNNLTQKYDGYLKEDNTLTKLLTIDDIPSSSGVVSINGATGVVTLYASNLPLSDSDPTTVSYKLSQIDADISTINTVISNIKNCFAFIEDGNTATNNIPSGSAVIWKNNAYLARQNIAAGATLSSTNLLALPDNGYINKLIEKDNSLDTAVTNIQNLMISPTPITGQSSQAALTIIDSQIYEFGKIVFGNVSFTTNATIAAGKVLISLLPAMKTTLSGGVSIASCANSVSEGKFSITKTLSGNSSNIVSVSSIPAGTHIASFCYLAV